MSDKLVKVESPRGTFEWVVHTGEGKENLSGDMKYVVNLVLDPQNIEADKKFIDSIHAFWEANKPKGFKKKPKSLGYKLHDVVTDDEGNPVLDDEDKKVYDSEGKVFVVFNTSTTWPAKGDEAPKPKVIKVYNAKNVVVDLAGQQIGNGSEGYVSGAMDIYVTKAKEAGVTLYLNAIQLMKFVEFNQDAGFAVHAEEDGWTGEAEESPFEGKAMPRV